MNTLVFMLATVLLAAVPLWAQPGGANVVGNKGIQVHGAPVPVDPNEEQGLAGALKKAKLGAFPAKTLGAAVDDYHYFTKREWKETRSAGGKIYVDFTGWLKTGKFDLNAINRDVSSRGVGIKFLVTSDGNYGAVMASKVEIKTDGLMYSQPLDDLNGILKKIYDNKEIKF